MWRRFSKWITCFLRQSNFSVSPRLQKGSFHGGVLKGDKVLWDVRASNRRVLVGIPHGELRVGLLCHQEDSNEEVLKRQTQEGHDWRATLGSQAAVLA